MVTFSVYLTGRRLQYPWLAYLLINPPATCHKLLRLLFHPHTKRSPFIDLFLRGVLADVLGDLHGAEKWATHGTEVRELLRPNLLDPVYYLKSFYPPKVLLIIRNDSKSILQGRGGDKNICIAN
jgi:hypothetical protein